ncbi:hypothetical protein ACN27G_02635 [Plantactinospora sp. WMMB334]
MNRPGRTVDCSACSVGRKVGNLHSGGAPVCSPDIDRVEVPRTAG